MKTLHDRIAEVQATINAPKTQNNTFGGYKYRSCEDILMAVKPLLNGLVLTISDEVVAIHDRVYVKATATITDGKESIVVSAFAREAITKKGMDESQITGSTSSYARKYALNGLLLIDDNKDADHADNRGEGNGKLGTITESQAANITALAEETSVPISSICKRYNTAKLTEIPSLAYHEIITKLEHRRAA